MAKKLVKVGNTSFFWEDVVAIQSDERLEGWLTLHMKYVGKPVDVFVPALEIEQVLKDFEASRASEDELRAYDPGFGDERECKCGHPYYRHFDTYDHMDPIGCKYCQCFTWEYPGDYAPKRRHSVTDIDGE